MSFRRRRALPRGLAPSGASGFSGARSGPGFPSRPAKRVVGAALHLCSFRSPCGSMSLPPVRQRSLIARPPQAFPSPPGRFLLRFGFRTLYASCPATAAPDEDGCAYPWFLPCSAWARPIVERTASATPLRVATCLLALSAALSFLVNGNASIRSSVRHRRIAFFGFCFESVVAPFHFPGFSAMVRAFLR